MDVLLPFCRLDPAEDPLAEGERCLAAGARGIKLHPRAQAFGFASPEMEGIFALAEEAGVPILIHAGRGLPPLGDELVDLTLRHPDVVLILAHGAICDQGIITSRLADHPGVLYDISCFFPLDVIELLARAPIERIVFASDPPYGLPASSLYMALRVAAHAGLDEAAVRGLLGGTVAGLFDGHDLPPVTTPRRGSSIALSGRLARVYGYASLAGPAIFMGSAEQAQAMLDMALAACRDPDPGDVGEALETIGGGLERRAPCSSSRARTAGARRSIWSTARASAPPPSCRTLIDRRAASHTTAHSPRSRRSRSRMPSSPNACTTSSTCSFSSPPASRCAGATGHLTRQIEQQRTQQVRHHHERPCRPVCRAPSSPDPAMAAPAPAGRSDAPRCSPR